MNTLSKLTLVLIFILASHYKIIAQFDQAEQTTFYRSKVDNPIKIEVLERDNKYQFVAINRSFYPYQIELTFNSMSNLSPMLNKSEHVVFQGRTNLILLTVVDQDQSPNFNYSVSYVIGLPSDDVDLKHPYLIPVKNKFNLVYGSDSTRFFNNGFKLSPGDTVYNMRKGYVVASPNMYHESDRITDKTTLEIMHDDGTIMIYRNIDPKSLLVDIGEKIYPMQPLGIINKGEVLLVSLHKFEGNGKIETLFINYSMGIDKTERFTHAIPSREIIHPNEVIILEMSRREKRKYKKGTLYLKRKQ